MSTPSDKGSKEFEAMMAKWKSNEFGSVYPDPPELRQFSLGPWHELRRQIALFLAHVIPADPKEMDVRENPSPEIEKRCDFFVLDLIRAKDKKKCQPAPELRKWLAVRAEMAMYFVTREAERHANNPAKTPDLKKNFEDEVGIRLTVYWHRLGKEMWLANDPNQSSRAE